VRARIIRTAVTAVEGRRRRPRRWSRIDNGQTLAGTPYTVIAPRGCGGMSEVYDATRRGTPGRVAIKLLSASLQHHSGLGARMRQEAAALRCISAQNVVAWVDEGITAEGRPFIVTELLVGRTLRAHIQRFGAVTAARARRFVAALLSGLNAVHRAGLVHCDVKLDNVHLGHNGRVTLLDFGAVEPRPPSPHDDLSSDSQVEHPALGTPRYMAPEQRKGHRVDADTDVFAAGLLLLELLLGGWPFLSNRDTSRCLDAVRDGTPPRWLARDIPAALLQVIGRATANARAARYPDTTAMLRALLGLTEAPPPVRDRLPVFSAVARHEPAEATVGGAIWRVRHAGTSGSVRHEQLVVRGYIPVHGFEVRGGQRGGVASTPLNGVEVFGDVEPVHIAQPHKTHGVPLLTTPHGAGEGPEGALVPELDLETLHHRRGSLGCAADQRATGAQIEGATRDLKRAPVGGERAVSSYSDAIASFHGGRIDHVGGCKCGMAGARA
jgi:hypothetical protein